MRKLIIALILLLSSCTSKKEPDWIALKLQLEEIEKNDQLYREDMDSLQEHFGWQSVEMQTAWKKQNRLDSIDLVQVETILSTVGYPPKAKVGKANEAVFYTLQHSPDSIMEKYYEVITHAGEAGEIPTSTVALYVDRVLMNKGEPQLYGSQIRVEYKTDRSGRKYDSVFLWKLKDPDRVEEMRKKAGLEPLSEYLEHFTIDPTKGYRLNYAPTN